MSHYNHKRVSFDPRLSYSDGQSSSAQGPGLNDWHGHGQHGSSAGGSHSLGREPINIGGSRPYGSAADIFSDMPDTRFAHRDPCDRGGRPAPPYSNSLDKPFGMGGSGMFSGPNCSLSGLSSSLPSYNSSPYGGRSSYGGGGGSGGAYGGSSSFGSGPYGGSSSFGSGSYGGSSSFGSGPYGGSSSFSSSSRPFANSSFGYGSCGTRLSDFPSSRTAPGGPYGGYSSSSFSSYRPGGGFGGSSGSGGWY